MLLQIAFTVLSLAIQGGLYYYVWRRLVRDTALPIRKQRIATAILLASYLLFPLTIWSFRGGLGNVASYLAWFVFPMMAFAGMSAAVLFLADSARFSLWLGQRARKARCPQEPQNQERRLFLARATSASTVAIVTGAMAHGASRALGEPKIERTTIALDRWPVPLTGLTIAHITDLHAGLTIDRGYVERVVDRTNALGADLIFLTGDLVDGTVADIGGRTEPLANLRARLGIFGVTGNHEYYSGVDAWLEEFGRLGIRMLRNEHVIIEDKGEKFLVVGINDHMARRIPGHGADIKKAMHAAPRDIPGLLLAHQPKQIKSAIFRKLDLQVSGHTHGGQVWPWHYLVAAQQGGFLAGLYKKDGTTLYVGRGAGYWGPPVRIGAPPEIGLLTLIPGKPPESH